MKRKGKEKRFLWLKKKNNIKNRLRFLQKCIERRRDNECSKGLKKIALEWRIKEVFQQKNHLLFI